MNHKDQTLYTDRLNLRPWCDGDLPLFAQMNADNRVMEHFPATLSREESNRLAERIQEHFNDHGFGLWAVAVRGVAPFVGFVGLSVPRFEAHFTPCVEIGWRGSCAFRSITHSPMFTTISDSRRSLNPKSTAREHRVTPRHGKMRRSPDEDFDHPALPEGHILRRHVLYRMTSSDWQPEASAG